MMTTLYRAEIVAAAAAHDLDPDLVEAIVLTESSGQTDAFRFEPGFYARYLQGRPAYAGANPRRISSSYGLMQVMAVVAAEHGLTGDPEQLFVPGVGLEYGCRHLRMLLDWAHGDVAAACAAYNGGKGGNAPGGPLRNEGYVRKVRTAHARVVAAHRA
jgi:soluble lytic murein transglycosylase-like protein